jgi:hypothetical protein
LYTEASIQELDEYGIEEILSLATRFKVPLADAGFQQRSLLREQGAWESPSSHNARLWEHLESEDAWRRRPLLVPNPNGTDHRHASQIQQMSGGSKSAATASDDAADGGEAAGGGGGGGGGGGNGATHGGQSDEAGSEAALGARLKHMASLAKQASVGMARDGSHGGGEGAGEEENDDDENDVAAAGGDAERGGEDGGGEADETLAETSMGSAASGGAGATSPSASHAVLSVEEAWDESVLFHEEGELIWRGGVVRGVVALTRVALTFQAVAGTPPAPSGSEEPASSGERGGDGVGAAVGGVAVDGSRLWRVSDLRQLQKRRYLLMHTALEVFVGSSAVFLQLITKRRREALRRALRRVGVPERSWRTSRPALQEAWHRREITNFEYLMELNTLAGRTYNDLNQYPVFPWSVTPPSATSLPRLTSCPLPSLHAAWPPTVGLPSSSLCARVPARPRSTDVAHAPRVARLRLGSAG